MGSTARPRYIGLREISERDILELYCIRFVSGNEPEIVRVYMNRCFCFVQ